jgi:sulfur relay (sulfurtransferase) complex TusBCD TusD component (DsrE family)
MLQQIQEWVLHTKTEKNVHISICPQTHSVRGVAELVDRSVEIMNVGTKGLMQDLPTPTLVQ